MFLLMIFSPLVFSLYFLLLSLFEASFLLCIIGSIAGYNGFVILYKFDINILPCIQTQVKMKNRWLMVATMLLPSLMEIQVKQLR